MYKNFFILCLYALSFQINRLLSEPRNDIIDSRDRRMFTLKEIVANISETLASKLRNGVTYTFSNSLKKDDPNKTESDTLTRSDFLQSLMPQKNNLTPKPKTLTMKVNINMNPDKRRSGGLDEIFLDTDDLTKAIYNHREVTPRDIRNGKSHLMWIFLIDHLVSSGRKSNDQFNAANFNNERKVIMNRVKRVFVKLNAVKDSLKGIGVPFYKNNGTHYMQLAKFKEPPKIYPIDKSNRSKFLTSHYTKYSKLKYYRMKITYPHLGV